MSLTFLIVLGLFGIYLMMRSRTDQPAAGPVPREADVLTLAELAQAGSDLARQHTIEFFLYFPSRSSADEAAVELRRDGFNTEIRPGEDSADWLCLATREMLPELAALQLLRQRLTAFAESRDGVYDGWGTEVQEPLPGGEPLA